MWGEKLGKWGYFEFVPPLVKSASALASEPLLPPTGMFSKFLHSLSASDWTSHATVDKFEPQIEARSNASGLTRYQASEPSSCKRRIKFLACAESGRSTRTMLP